MSITNPQGNNSQKNGSILGVISSLSLVLVIALALIFRTSLAVLGVLIGCLGTFFQFLSVAPNTRRFFEEIFKKFPYRQVFLALSFTLNIILAIIILVPNIPTLVGHFEQQPLTTSSITSTTTVGSTSTATITPIITVAPTSTAMAIYMQATSGTPIITDSLNAQDSLNWDNYSNQPSGSCVFKNGAYHSIATPGNSNSCDATSTNFSDLALQTEMDIIQGDNGGIVFRSNEQEDSFYAFCVTTNGGYLLEKSSPSSNVQDYTPIFSGKSSVIHSGPNQQNVLTVIMHGATFYLYVNKNFVGSASDKSYTSGAIGIFTNSLNATEEAAFTSMKVWKL